MYIGHKFRLYPTNEQKDALEKAFGCARWYWNYSLDLCQRTFKETGKGLTRNKIQSLLPGLKKKYEWLKTDIYSQCLQVVALNLSTAYKNFFEKRAGFPKFKSRRGKQSISYPQNTKIKQDCIQFPKLGDIYCRFTKEVEGEIKMMTISKTPELSYFVSIIVDDGRELPPLSSDGKAVGIDVGLLDFCITSDGSKYSNPKHWNKHFKKLKRRQQKLSKKVKGSINRTKARLAVSKVHGKIARCREDFLHKLSRKLVNENQVLAVENLNIKGMVRNHNLAKAINDVGWGMFCTMLKYKTEREGKVYLEVDRFFPSSKTCNNCLHVVDKMPLDIRQWQCSKCGVQHDRDINASRNIRDEALRILAVGRIVTASGDNVRRAVGDISYLTDAVVGE